MGRGRNSKQTKRHSLKLQDSCEHGGSNPPTSTKKQTGVLLDIDSLDAVVENRSGYSALTKAQTE